MNTMQIKLQQKDYKFQLTNNHKHARSICLVPVTKTVTVTEKSVAHHVVTISSSGMQGFRHPAGGEHVSVDALLLIPDEMPLQQWANQLCIMFRNGFRNDANHHPEGRAYIKQTIQKRGQQSDADEY